jgi:hypothetical protein
MRVMNEITKEIIPCAILMGILHYYKHNTFIYLPKKITVCITSTSGELLKAQR